MSIPSLRVLLLLKQGFFLFVAWSVQELHWNLDGLNSVGDLDMRIALTTYRGLFGYIS